MFYILCAVIVAAAVFGLGVIVGGRRSPELPRQEKPEEVSAEAEKEAFAILMGYNADVAYGIKRMKEE
ncbi:MAG: hypothetical protein PUB32_04620 [Clostridiales bacterium]|nr:hypothetical protein [Clostridiales bacterium]